MPPKQSGAKASALDKLDLVVKRFPKGKTRDWDTGLLAVNILVNDQLIPTYTLSVPELVRSILKPGEYFFETCSCGEPGCAGIWNGVLVRHEEGLILWYAPQEFGGARPKKEEPLQHRVFRFARAAYQREVRTCLRTLIRLAQRQPEDEQPFPIKGDTVRDYQALLPELATELRAPTKEQKSAQERLQRSVSSANRVELHCALADGADLLQEDSGSCAWSWAVSFTRLNGWSGQSWLEAAAGHLPVPILGDRWRRYLLEEIMEDSYAEILQRVTRRGGPLALSAAERRHCDTWLTLRIAKVESEVGNAGDSLPRDCFDGRRDLFELHLMREVLERSAPKRKRTKSVAYGEE